MIDFVIVPVQAVDMEAEIFEPWKALSAFQFLNPSDLDITDDIFNLSEYESLQMGQRRSHPVRRQADEGTSQIVPNQNTADSEIVRTVEDFEISQSPPNDASTGNTVEVHPELMATWNTAPREIECHSISEYEEIVDQSSADTFTPRMTYMDFEDLEELKNTEPQQPQQLDKMSTWH